MQLRGIGAELDEAARARLRGRFDAVYVLDGDDAHLLPDLALSLDAEQVAVVLVRESPSPPAQPGLRAWVSVPIAREWLPGLTDPDDEAGVGLLEHLHAVAEDSWTTRVALRAGHPAERGA